jgi:transposase
MTPEKLFHELLGLGLNWEVKECEFDRREGVVHLRIEETEHLWEVERSPGAGARVTCYDHTEEMVWRHLNVFEHKCEIRCRLPRGKCRQTGKVYRVRPPWEGLSKHFTKSFEAMALLLMREMPVSAVSRQVKETDTRLWRMLKAHVAAAWPQMDWSNVICVGCDEMSVRKGQRYISVFCDLIGKRVLFATAGRDKTVWEAFVLALEEHNGHPRAIEEASIDMSAPYIAGARENLGSPARIVFDKFHVIAHANAAVDAVRRAELRREDPQGRQALKETRWIWLKNPENLTDKQKAKKPQLDQQNLAVPDPSRLLKIGADAFPGLKILATGSSTLAATHKFRDSLAGRKRNVHLVPVRHDELPAFGVRDLRHRLFRGGLPPALLAADNDTGFYSEWLDSYYARDVQELFRVEKRAGFLKLVESVLRLSGGQMEATALAQLCGISRPTVLNYLDVLELTHVAAFIRPYSGGGKRELVRQPKVYGFDTGFVAFARGWTDLRPEDCGLLWKHVVLDRLISSPSEPGVMYWRDKDRHEIDFVLPKGRGAADAIECKWSADRFDPKNLQVFRALHPAGKNIVVATNVQKPHTREVGGLTVTFTGLDDLAL